MTTTTETGDDFAMKCGTLVTQSYTCLCMALGHKLRLFDHLRESPQTSAQIAESAGLRERYVREWLNTMAVGGIVEVNENGDQFWLPVYRREVLAADSGILLMAAYVPRFAVVFDQVAACFNPSGPTGTPYSAYADFHESEAEYSDRSFIANLIDKFIPSIPGLVDQLHNGIVCLDIGCGRGTPSYLLAKNFPKSTFYGLDFGGDAIKFAEDKAKLAGLTNVHYVVCDAAKLPSEWSNKFDYVTAFDAIHDQAYPEVVLKEICRVLKPDGTFSMVDINADTNVAQNMSMFGREFLYASSLFHCMPVSLYFEGGMGLGAAWGKQKAAELLKEAGYTEVIISAGISADNFHCLAKKPWA